MIKKLDLRENVEIIPIKGSCHDYCLAKSSVLIKINELIDAVNKLKTMAKNTNTVLESLVQENNIHEKQIDELQMKIEPEKCETPAENVLIKTLRMEKEFAEEECKRLQTELDRTKKRLEIYHEFVTKLYLNGNITDESLIRLQKRLYIQTKGGDNE